MGALIAIGAGIAVLTGIGAGVGIGIATGKAVDANRSLSRKICPSVMEITLVGIYADTSPACVSMIGSAVIEPPPNSSLRRLERSNSLECR